MSEVVLAVAHRWHLEMSHPCCFNKNCRETNKSDSSMAFPRARFMKQEQQAGQY